MKNQTQTYRRRIFECRCGESIWLRPSQIGVSFKCIECRSEHEVSCMSEMRSLREVSKRYHVSPWLQFSMKSLVLWVVPASIAAWLYTIAPSLVEAIFCFIVVGVVYFSVIFLLLSSRSLLESFWDCLDSNRLG